MVEPKSKQAIRAILRESRDQLPSGEHAVLSGEIGHSLIAHILQPMTKRLQRPLTVMGFMPFRSEVDVVPVLDWCWQAGHTVVLPRVDRHSRDMRVYRIAGDEELETGAWGIREPKADLPELDSLAAIDVVLVPGLAFDLKLGRLGYGGGYYDRFLEKFTGPGLPGPLKVAPAFELQLIPEVPTETHDFRLDLIVTESRKIGSIDANCH
jgi:5-formyltetrahydrofolate cyclo-ligase